MNYSRSLTGTGRARARRPPCRRPGKRALAHLFQLGAGGHLLGEQRGLDAVEQPLQPAHQLRLGDAQFGVRRRGVLVEGQGETVEFLTQFRRQALFQFPDAGGVYLAQPVAAGVIQRRGAHFLEQLLDHGPDSHHLCRLLDQIGQGALVGIIVGDRHHPRVDAADDFDVVVIVAGTQNFTILRGLWVWRRAAWSPFINSGAAIVVDQRPRLRLIQ